jgi:hypothetical protein
VLTIFTFVPLEVLEPLLAPSELLPTLFWRLTEGGYHEPSEVDSKIRLVGAVIKLLQRLKEHQLHLWEGYRLSLREQFGNTLARIASNHNCHASLSDSLATLLHVFEQ